jgi:hypothetical protein
MRPSFLALLAEAALRDDRLDEPRSCLTAAREPVAKTGERCYESEILRLTGELASRHGRQSEAIERLQQAVGVARQPSSSLDR